MAVVVFLRLFNDSILFMSERGGTKTSGTNGPQFMRPRGGRVRATPSATVAPGRILRYQTAASTNPAKRPPARLWTRP